MQFSVTTKGMVVSIPRGRTVNRQRGPGPPEVTEDRKIYTGAPYEVRTRVPALRGRCPRPLDEGSGRVDRARTSIAVSRPGTITPAPGTAGRAQRNESKQWMIPS